MKRVLLAAVQNSHSVILAGIGMIGFLLLTVQTAPAADDQVPWECSNYEGAAQTRCLNAFIELQREKIGQLETQLHTQQGLVDQLKKDVDRQSAATTDLQRQLSDRNATAMTPIPYTYSYFYPPTLGLGLYLGRPWIYGSPYYFGSYWGPRYYRHWHGR